MSSNSEDEYYTNSVSRLRALKNQEILENEAKSTPNAAVILFSDEEDKIEESKFETVTSVTKEPDVISVSDEEIDTSLNIISVINEVLEKSKRPCRRQPRRSVNIPQNQVPKKTVKAKRPRRTRRRQNVDALPDVSIQQINLLEEDRRQIVNALPEGSTQQINTVDLTEETDQMIVKVCWCFQNTEKFIVRRYESLEKIFQHFSQRHNIPESRLLFTLDNSNQVISPTDTPVSLKLNVGSIIEGGFLNSEQQDCVKIRSKIDEDLIELKVQLKDRKHPLFVSVRTSDSMEVFMHKSAEQLLVPVDKLKFYFDGDAIHFSDTVTSLELSGGECIDCVYI